MYWWESFKPLQGTINHCEPRNWEEWEREKQLKAGYYLSVSHKLPDFSLLYTAFLLLTVQVPWSTLTNTCALCIIPANSYKCCFQFGTFSTSRLLYISSLCFLAYFLSVLKFKFPRNRIWLVSFSLGAVYKSKVVARLWFFCFPLELGTTTDSLVNSVMSIVVSLQNRVCIPLGLLA
jgi:hypothetical protein